MSNPQDVAKVRAARSELLLQRLQNTIAHPETLLITASTITIFFSNPSECEAWPFTQTVHVQLFEICICKIIHAPLRWPLRYLVTALAFIRLS